MTGADLEQLVLDKRKLKKAITELKQKMTADKYALNDFENRIIWQKKENAELKQAVRELVKLIDSDVAPKSHGYSHDGIWSDHYKEFHKRSKALQNPAVRRIMQEGEKK